MVRYAGGDGCSVGAIVQHSLSYALPGRSLIHVYDFRSTILACKLWKTEVMIISSNVEPGIRFTLAVGLLRAIRHLHHFFLADNLKPYTTAEKCVHYILTKCIVWHLCHMAVKRGHWMSRVLREWMLHGTIVLGIFSMDFRGKVLSHYSFSVKRYLWRTLLIRENCCSGVN